MERQRFVWLTTAKRVAQGSRIFTEPVWNHMPACRHGSNASKEIFRHDENLCDGWNRRHLLCDRPEQKTRRAEKRSHWCGIFYRCISRTLPPLTYWLTCFLCHLIGWGDFLIWNLTFSIYLFLHQKTPNNHGALFFYIIHLASHNLILYLLYIDQNIANMDHLDYHHNCLRLLNQTLKFLIVNH